MRLALVALLLLQDPIDRLGDSDPAVREQATRELRKTRPLDALRRAKDHADPEIRGRASALLADLEREMAQETREKERRPAAMKTLAADQTPGPGLALTDGARFKVTKREWESGTIFETLAEQFLDGDLAWDVAGIGDRKVERCTLHSPRVVYVPGPEPESARISIKGLRRWYCETPVEFKDPRAGEFWRCGGIEVAIRWPELIVRVDRPTPQWVLEKTLSWTDVKVVLRNPSGYDAIGVGGGGGGRFGARLGGKKPENPAWCGCPGKPSEEKRESPKTAREHAVKALPYSDVPLENIASISLTLHKPVEEAFETVSAPVK